MSGGLKWTEEQLADYERRTGLGGRRPLATHDVPAPARERPSAGEAPRARRNPSALETELGGHLAVMQLEPVAQYKFHPERRWRFDFAFVDELVAVELDGGIFAAENGTEAGRHARGAGRIKDYEKRNAAAELGWLVLCYGPPQVRSGEAALQVERLVRARRAARSSTGHKRDDVPQDHEQSDRAADKADAIKNDRHEQKKHVQR